MFRNPLAFCRRWFPACLWLGAALALVPACTPATDSGRSASSEQTAEVGLSPDKLEAPALRRRLLLADLGVERWHQQGWRGQGVKIALLDSGFRDYRKFLGKGLPPRVHTRSFRADHNLQARDSQHGIFCGEVLHALAPDAELLLANWEPDSPRSFLDAVRWARPEGARVISCSLIMPSWSDGEGGGAVHRGLQAALGNGYAQRDVLCFASAGNTAQRHWSGTYAPAAAGWHCWRPGIIDNAVKPWGKDRVAVEFYGPLHSAFEVLVFQRQTGALIGASMLHADGTGICGRAMVRFEPDPQATYQVRVRRREVRPGVDEAFHLVVLGGSLEYATSRGSIPFPGDGASVIAVGAVDEGLQRVAYSSCGPNSALPKPDFVASVPFPSLCRERPFAGTSAAAPQAAGLAALLYSQHPDWTPRQVLQAMRQAALDLGPPGHDYDTGYGLIRLPGGG